MNYHFSSVAQSFSLFVTPLTAACQVSLSITNSGSLLKFMSIKSVMPSNHLILCHPLLLLPSIFPALSLSNESVLRIRWPKCWSFCFIISPNEYSGLISIGLTGLISLQSRGLLRVVSNTTVQKYQFFGIKELESWGFLYGLTLTSIHDYWKNHSFDKTDIYQQSNVSAF